VSDVEKCACLELQEVVEEGAVIEQTLGKAGVERVVYLLPHPSGDEDEARLMLFCPFCGQAAGDALTFRAELWADN